MKPAENGPGVQFETADEIRTLHTIFGAAETVIGEPQSNITVGGYGFADVQIGLAFTEPKSLEFFDPAGGSKMSTPVPGRLAELGNAVITHVSPEEKPDVETFIANLARYQ
jgi:hypothetical protein